MQRSALPYDGLLQGEIDRVVPKDDLFHRLAVGIPAVAAIVAVWQQNIPVAAFVFLTALVAAILTHGNRIATAAQHWNLKRRRNRAAYRHRKKLGDLIGRILEFTNSGRVDSVLHAFESIGSGLLQGIHPSSITEPLRFDLQLIDQLKKRDLVVSYERFLQAVLTFNTGFVHQTLQKLRTAQDQKQYSTEREEMDRALARWDRFLDDVEDFMRKLNREGDFEFNVSFERAGRL